MFSWLCHGRCLEFFEGDNGCLSMTRLLMFLSFWPSSYVVVGNANEGMLGWYIGGYVLGYVGGKGADVFMHKRDDVSSSFTERSSSVTSTTRKPKPKKQEGID